MKTISIENDNRYCMVDDEDFERLLQYKWYANKNGSLYRGYKIGGKSKRVALASEIMHQPNQMFDHKDCDPFNNQKENLRVCTYSQNVMNTTKAKGKTSKYKGVCFYKAKNKWRASICLFGNRLHLGDFDTEIEAGLAYNKKAVVLFKEFAKLNVI